MQGNTVCLNILLGNLLYVFTVSTTWRGLNASSNYPQLSNWLELSTCQLKILGKEEHDHTMDISKTTPVMVAAAKKIKENLMLAPVGQCASKLYRYVLFTQPPARATKLLVPTPQGHLPQRSQPIAWHTIVTHQIKCVCCALFSAAHLWPVLGRKLLNFMESWLNFFCPILGHFCPLFIQIAQMGLILPRWGLILPRIPPPTPVLYSAVTKSFQGYVQTRNSPNPPQKQPFSWPDFESGHNELLSGQNGPHLGKRFEKWAKFF